MKVVLFIISANSIEAQNVSANWRAIQKKNMTRLNFVLLHTTIIHKKFEGDTYFPNYDLSRWALISETRNYDLVNKFSYSYLTYQAQ